MSYSAPQLAGFWDDIGGVFDRFFGGETSPAPGEPCGAWVTNLDRWNVWGCPTPPAAVALEAFRGAPRPLVEDFAAALRAANEGEGPTYAQLVAGCGTDQVVAAAWGGSDCIASSSAGQTAKRLFLQLLPYAAPATGGGGGSGGGNGLPPLPAAGASPLVWAAVAGLAILALRR